MFRNIILLLGLLSAPLLMAGCASTGGIAPDGKPEMAQTLQADRTFAAAGLSAADWPATDWWKAFGDPQLDRLESAALKGSPTLDIARARSKKALALAGEVKSALVPQVTGNFASTRQRFSENGLVPEPFAGSWETQNRLALDFSYEFDVWGKNRAAVAAALSRAQATDVDVHAARLALSVEVARAYVQLAHGYERLDIAEATLKARQRIYALTQQRVAAGIDTRVELKQAEGAIPEVREEIASLDEAVAVTRNQLAALLGEGPDRGLDITRPALQNAGTVALPSRLPADLIGRRPDVIAQRWRVEAAARDIEVARTQFYPNINLLAFAGLQSIGLDQLFESGSHVVGVGPAISLPVFEGGRLRSRLAGRSAGYDAAVGQYNQALSDALRDIADRLAAIRSVQAQSRQQQLALDAVREAYRLALLRYRDGIGSYLTVLSVEGQVLAQQRLEADLHARARDNRIGLIRALGGGFDGGTTPQVAGETS